MWAVLGLALVLCLLPGGGTEHWGHCKEPPEWSIGEENPMMTSRGSMTVVALLQASCFLCRLQASRLGYLQLKLASIGLVNISFIVVNHQGNHSQLNYQLLRKRVSEDIPVYQQNATQPDVWATLRGKKDDFLIYDRCGRLVYHLGFPSTFLSYPFVEKTIKIAYCEDTCGNCSYTTPEIEEICKRISENPEEKQIEAASTSQLPPTEHPHHHHHHHGHHPKGDRPEVNYQHSSTVLGQDPAEAALLSAAVEVPLQGDRL